MEWAVQTVGAAALTALTVQALANAGSINRRIKTRFGSDHQTIFAGYSATGTDNRDRVYAVVRCAPSQRRIWPETDLGVARAFAAQALGGAVPSAPEVFSDQGLQMRKRPSGQLGANCWLWCNGLIELSLPTSSGAPEADEPFQVNIVEIANVVLLLTGAIEAGWFSRLYPGKRAEHVRLDWSVAISRNVQTVDGSRAWEQLTFPSIQPGDRGHDATAPFPARSLAPELSRRRQRAKAEDISRDLLHQFIYAAGYRKFDESLNDVLTIAGRDFE